MRKQRTTVRRVTVSLREADVINLEFISACTGLGQNDVIRKALATEAFVQEQLLLGGALLVENPETGQIRQVAFVG